MFPFEEIIYYLDFLKVLEREVLDALQSFWGFWTKSIIVSGLVLDMDIFVVTERTPLY
jgi:hypothetical protein